ncbi:MAG: tRNA preQ1(34) S-adenosylmethionine ribosyltransferase-isomerase QueA [Deltaproteobacteria bacterium]|jgi:S-adenosylmethionine:tRNA ribosyltransferase-isomerase|nr:tRNA preQ1(34) S-adenosylmethionine ribosyltransferase-isomerase QueA [Deltaproteobacteria bacterium]
MSFDFRLPPELIAQKPPDLRGDSRLMVVDRASKEIYLADFSDLETYLPPNSVLVLNEAKVTPARLLGHRQSGGRAEVLLLSPPAPGSEPGVYVLKALVKPGHTIKPGRVLIFTKDLSVLKAEVLAVEPDGQRLLRFNFTEPPEEVLDALGHMPLPPYIKRPDGPSDKERYQTVFAKRAGAVAAPTAGLHFSAEHLRKIEAAGHTLARVFLRVGAGTFAPLTERELISGRLHPEEYEICPKARESIFAAQKKGRRVVAVGTTAARTLEWGARSGELKAEAGQTDLFIRPGYRFKIVDSLLTNFHLPGTSLLLLVTALAGEELIHKAYNKAINERFKFYSYGDAMLIL